MSYKNKEWLYDQYWKQKKSQKEIAREFHYSDTTIRKYIELHKIPKKSKMDLVKKYKSKLFHNREWLYTQYITLKKTQRQIAEEFNLHQALISKWMNIHNISSRLPEITSLGNKSHTGLKTSEETKKKLSEAFNGSKNPAWKGNDAGYNALHRWVRKKKGNPIRCEKCGKVDDKKFELANISGKYTRNPEDYMYLCNRCHKIYDRTIYNILSKNKKYLYGGGFECI